MDAPYEGALWTPGYWGFYGGFYRFHHGYWGLHIGFYGGVDYGYGYVGHGYYGGYWNGGHFFYNTTITRVNVNVIRNVYVHPVMINNLVITGRIGNRVSFNGGRGGVVARPLPAETRVLQERRISPMATQVQAQHAASRTGSSSSARTRDVPRLPWRRARSPRTAYCRRHCHQEPCRRHNPATGARQDRGSNRLRDSRFVPRAGSRDGMLRRLLSRVRASKTGPSRSRNSDRANRKPGRLSLSRRCGRRSLSRRRGRHSHNRKPGRLSHSRR